MSTHEEIQIGPNPCLECGGEYGEHAAGCSLAASRGSAEESELRNELKGVREMLRRECVDWAEDHTYAQNVAKRVGVPEKEVEGDSYGVPAIQDLIDMIAERIPPNVGSERPAVGKL